MHKSFLTCTLFAQNSACQNLFYHNWKNFRFCLNNQTLPEKKKKKTLKEKKIMGHSSAGTLKIFLDRSSCPKAMQCTYPKYLTNQVCTRTMEKVTASVCSSQNRDTMTGDRTWVQHDLTCLCTILHLIAKISLQKPLLHLSKYRS